MLVSVRDGVREVVGGSGPAFDFVNDFSPGWLNAVFDDDCPTASGLHVWEGRGALCGEFPGYRVRYSGSWRPATGLDLLMFYDAGSN